MTTLSKKLERLIRNNPEILPIKTEQGIFVGSVLIVNNGSIKNLYQHGELVYKNIYLNAVAIRLANLLAKGVAGVKVDNLYQADQEYGKWFIDSQFLRNQYEKLKNLQEFDRADILWARYVESRSRTARAKNSAEALCKF